MTLKFSLLKGKVKLLCLREENRKKVTLKNISDLNIISDFIRMLDADGYPKAFIETEHLKFEFFQASLKKARIIGDVKITKK